MSHDEDDATAFLAARELIAEHGDGVAAFLQAKIDDLTAKEDYAQLSAWLAIRNAVALSIGTDTTLQ
ncbi:hypothetical protein AWL63_24305 (plasmid) [Sphingomonas panacis]|uniref:Uncharacterized protein n=1 Tax=Sphingomonas panacis TaxID=1560345 RepID=A0A1B3ZIL6_9SPHN|nr:hypothetical protein [Sphingomonas panacis]AOH87275.1 hypothetical protein AWL63_24305 [Sphingomonas panacis]